MAFTMSGHLHRILFGHKMISILQYITIADNVDQMILDINNSYNKISAAMGISTTLRSSLREIMLHTNGQENVPLSDLFLLKFYSDANSVRSKISDDYKSTSIFVSALQLHVSKNYPTGVNGFLHDNLAKVKSNFAGISASAGYIIDSGNISV